MVTDKEYFICDHACQDLEYTKIYDLATLESLNILAKRLSNVEEESFMEFIAILEYHNLDLEDTLNTYESGAYKYYNNATNTHELGLLLAGKLNFPINTNYEKLGQEYIQNIKKHNCKFGGFCEFYENGFLEVY